MVEISTDSPKAKGREVKAYVDLGADCDDAATRFGKDVVFSNYVANVKITARGALLRYIIAGLTDEQIQEKFSAFKPGVSMERVIDPLAAAAKMLEGKSVAEREEFFAKLRARIEGTA